MPATTIIYGEGETDVSAPTGTVLGDVIAQTDFPFEQPCAGRGTCGQCKVLADYGLAPPDEIEAEHLTPGEMRLGSRLACRARIAADTRVVLAPVVVYSNKNFRASRRYKRDDTALGIAIDLGSTTVAAFLTTLDDYNVAMGAATLNQQAVFGADLISRLGAAHRSADNTERLHRLALSSITQAVDALLLPDRVRQRVTRVTVVGNPAMHHLLMRLPVESLGALPFQPFDKTAIHDGQAVLGSLFPEGARIALPPLIGGFVGSDALACLAAFGFDDPTGPMACIDLGTNGEVMVTDGERIVTASTAAGPAFEGVNISCGTRAVEGAVVEACIHEGELELTTIGDEPAIGLTGSGLISLIHELCQIGVIEPSGRIAPEPPLFGDQMTTMHEAQAIALTEAITLSQWDIRELQKAKGAIRAAIDILLAELGLSAQDLRRLILTGSFGGQVAIDSIIGLGLIPPVQRDVVEAIPNGAGLGAAMFLSDEGFALGESLAQRAEQIDLDRRHDFMSRYIAAMRLTPGSGEPNH